MDTQPTTEDRGTFVPYYLRTDLKHNRTPKRRNSQYQRRRRKSITEVFKDFSRMTFNSSPQNSTQQNSPQVPISNENQILNYLPTQQVTTAQKPGRVSQVSQLLFQQANEQKRYSSNNLEKLISPSVHSRIYEWELRAQSQSQTKLPRLPPLSKMVPDIQTSNTAAASQTVQDSQKSFQQTQQQSFQQMKTTQYPQNNYSQHIYKSSQNAAAKPPPHPNKPTQHHFPQTQPQVTSPRVRQSPRSPHLISPRHTSPRLAPYPPRSPRMNSPRDSPRSPRHFMNMNISNLINPSDQESDFRSPFAEFKPNENAESEMFELVFRNSPIPMAVITIQGHFHKVNVKFCQLLGYTETELKGRRVSEFTLDKTNIYTCRLLNEARVSFS
jgi:hypothetical protein